MLKRHRTDLRNNLENLAINGYQTIEKSKATLWYGQKRFTSAIRKEIGEEFEELMEEYLAEHLGEQKEDLDIDIRFTDLPDGTVLMARDHLSWEPGE